ncbi:MAG TPA: hypothetical protein VGH66_16985 [Acidimicrobiales bacterium]
MRDPFTLPVGIGGDSRAAVGRAGRAEGGLGVSYDFDAAVLQRVDQRSGRAGRGTPWRSCTAPACRRRLHRAGQASTVGLRHPDALS